MKILFVEKKLRIDKLGVCYLAAVLKKAGHKVDLVQDDLEDADKYLAENPADFVMYSTTSDEANWVIKRNRELKAKHNFISAVGGPDPTFVPARWTQDAAIDYVVQGPGENVVLNIINGSAKRLSRGDLLGKFNYISPDRTMLYKYDEFGKARMKRFIAGRYCLFSCAHCFNNAFKKLYIDQRQCLTYRPPAETMIQEIIDVKNKYGLEFAFFNDDDIAADPNWIAKFCELLLAANIPVSFGSSIRATSVDEKRVKMMANAGCKFLNIGLESANVETQKLLRRGPLTNDDIYRATRWCEEAGIKVRLQVMLGLPVEDPLKDALETFEFVKKCQPTDCSGTIYQPLPGTELWSYCIEKGLINDSTRPAGYFDKTVLKIKDAEKINRLGKYWHWATKKKWPTKLLMERINAPMSETEAERLTQLAREECAKELYGL